MYYLGSRTIGRLDPSDRGRAPDVMVPRRWRARNLPAVERYFDRPRNAKHPSPVADPPCDKIPDLFTRRALAAIHCLRAPQLDEARGRVVSFERLSPHGLP